MKNINPMNTIAQRSALAMSAIGCAYASTDGIKGTGLSAHRGTGMAVSPFATSFVDGAVATGPQLGRPPLI